jgi:phosphoglycolate phosphatase-like HAD superfamily hydrolase
MTTLIPCYLFDIDGTLSDVTHRLHYIAGTKDWDSFFAACVDDPPIEHACTLARTLIDADREVIFVSGRSDRVHDETRTWLKQHVHLNAGYGLRLYMRKHGDHREDHVVKGELLDRIIQDGFTPLIAFDDRDQVVKMWRECGVPCYQVAPGNF